MRRKVPPHSGTLRARAASVRSSSRLTAGAPTADIYWFSASGEQQSQLYGNRRIAPGDAFALTSPDGPRFCVTLAPMPSELERERPSLWRWLRGIFGPGER